MIENRVLVAVEVSVVVKFVDFDESFHFLTFLFDFDESISADEN